MSSKHTPGPLTWGSSVLYCEHGKTLYMQALRVVWHGEWPTALPLLLPPPGL